MVTPRTNFGRNMVRIALVAGGLLQAGQAAAQNWSFDARKIGMGGVGGGDNLATKMIEEQRDYTSIVLPLGLLQVLSNQDVFNPDSSDFNPIRAVEFAVAPLHVVIGRNDDTSAETLFVHDVRNATLSRKLSAYQGFVPVNSLIAEGLASPNFGKVFKFDQNPNGAFHGIYVGAGPYLSMHSDTSIDQALIDVLSTGVDRANQNFPLTESDEGQVALAITGGYRGRFAWPMGIGSATSREGLYVAVNFNALRGFAYENDTMKVTLLTDSTASITNASNIQIAHQHSTEGNGFAVDMGVGAVINRWELGFGARGIGNRITWTGVEATNYSLNSLTSGNSDFESTTSVAVPDVKVVLPVDYRANATYYADGWTGAVEFGHGFGGNSFHSGVERRFGRFEARGGERYTIGKWNPSGGIGVDLSPSVSFDVAVYGTTANLEQKRRAAIAASVRFNHMKK